MEETHEPLHLEKLKFGIVNDYGHTTCFIWIFLLFDEAFICMIM
jgi:hypothetical protein